MSRVRPLRNQVLVARAPVEQMKNGLYVPIASEKYDLFVEAVGPDVKGITPGDKLVCSAGPMAKVDGSDDLYLIDDTLVRGVIE
jgi:hypothetical protein